MILRSLLTTLTLATAISPLAIGAGPRALPPGQLPDDHRLGPLRDLNGYFPFIPPTSREEWKKRSEDVRHRILVSQGLWPMPTKAPLNPVIYGRIEFEDYTVEKVYFESAPGFYVTGNLFRPRHIQGKVPAVLFALRHWKDGRLSEITDAENREEIATGQERFEEGGKSWFQSMCVQLARMGCIAWNWDMLGNSDSRQIPSAVSHEFSRQRAEMNTVENWGLYSPQAEAHLQSIMGLQTWNSIRSLDFVLSLPEVDPNRIAMTGASGGGTQTMMLSAIDPRISLTFPAVMVGTAMQGGCSCENASLLRIGTGNVEFAALFAPKPLGMSCANDWTKELPTKGFPELKSLYTLLGAPDNVMISRGEQFPHNYNAVSRSAFYTWLNHHFHLGQIEPVIERDYHRLSPAELTVWDSAHPAPKAADPDFERQLLRLWHEDSERQLAELKEQNPDAYRKTLQVGWDVVLDGRLDDVGDITWDRRAKQDMGKWIQMPGLLRNTTFQEAVPCVFCYPKQWNGHTVIWLTDDGKSGLFQNDGTLLPEAQSILDSGATLLGLDLLYQGESLVDGKRLTQTPRVANPREVPAYTFGYNPAVFANRVQDVLSGIQYVKKHERPSKRVSLIAVDGTGPIAAAVRAQAGSALDQVAVHIGDFRFDHLLDLRSPDFLPGGAKYGDIPGLLALGTSRVLETSGANARLEAVKWLESDK